MRVAIDIRRAGDYGLGTYIRNIVNQLARINDHSRYLLIGQRHHLEEFDPLPDNFELLNIRMNRAPFSRISTCPGFCASAASTFCTCRGFTRPPWYPPGCSSPFMT